VAVDGAPVAGGAELAAGLAERLRALGRPALHLHAGDFLRPASVRLERGRHDSDAWYDDALDFGALHREVLGPLTAADDRGYLPTLWDPVADRATRERRRPAPADAVLLVDGVFLLHPALVGGFDVTIHLHLSTAARRRRVPSADAARELPAYDRYDEEVQPTRVADLLVRWDDPARPALLDRLR